MSLSQPLAMAPIATIVVPASYDPSNDTDFMNPVMLAYFRKMLADDRKAILQEIDARRKADAQSLGERFAEAGDIAAVTTQSIVDQAYDQKLSKKIQLIDTLIASIDQGDEAEYPYGYSVVSYEPIPVERLIARPTSRVTVDEQEVIDKERKGFNTKMHVSHFEM